MTEQFSDGIKRPRIYAYTTPQFEKTPWSGGRDGRGLLKVGYTTISAIQRVQAQFPTKAPTGSPFTILVDEAAVTDGGRYFRDSKVHEILSKNGCRRLEGEWFEATVDDVLGAINQAKTGQPFDGNRAASFSLRPEQRAAIDSTERYFLSPAGRPGEGIPHFLWNAKMRFGKIFTTYKLVERMKWKRILVLTYKPAVEQSWRDELSQHVDFSGWKFVGRGEGISDFSEGEPFIWFASFQDILGKSSQGGVKERFKAAHETEWDCVVIDEYHFGAWRDAAKELYDSDVSAESAAELKAAGEFCESAFPLNVNHFLYLSGTPFRVLRTGEFLDDQIFTWSYTDEQHAKETWDSTVGENPYAEMPGMTLMTYELPDELREAAINAERTEFDLNEFFRAELCEGVEGGGGSDYRFIHENEVQKWLHLIRGNHLPTSALAEKGSKRPPVPFENVDLQEQLTHTFWLLPSVAACHAMAGLIKRRQNAFYHDFEIVVAAGSEAGIGVHALPPVQRALGGNPLSSKSITLSCGKLATGVTVPPWSGVFMLRSTTSPETYFQAAFRVQSPWVMRNVDGNDPNSTEIIKHKCYVFDFAPNRVLALLSEYGSRIGADEKSSVEDRVSDFLKYLPVLCYDGYAMQPLDAKALLDYVAAGAAPSMLANRWQSNHLVTVDQITIEQLMKQKKLLGALEKLEGFRNLRQDLRLVISNERDLSALKKRRLRNGGAKTDEEKKAAQALVKARREVTEKLLKFVTRVPIFMYLTDFREEALKDVIRNREPELFSKVTGLSLNDFEQLCDLGVFNPHAMNTAIFAFKRFEEASLTYATQAELDGFAGGWDQSIPRAEVHRAIGP